MGQPNLETCQARIKAAHRYEVVDSNRAAAIVGRRFHLIGAGGVGMSGLAQIMLKNRAIVTGSDQTESHLTQQLCESGADIRIGHSANNLNPNTHAVVISAAIKDDNPELKLARSRGCRIYKYAEMLGILCNRYDGIAVAGTHGKSTTSGWLAYLLKQAGIDPNFIVGAKINQLNCSSGVGTGKYFVAEACEYDRSFLNLKPRIGCILNIEADHLDYYKNEDEIVEAFGRFAAGIRPGGILIANGEDPNVAKIIMDSRLRGNDSLPPCETFGFDKGCSLSAQNIRLIDGLYAFDIWRNGEFLGKTRISLAGRHNILNALAVVAMAVNTGLHAQRILELLATFTGIERRLTVKATIGQITVVDDYAHHPTEIKATLQAIRESCRPRRIWCVFQPHQYSRTRFLLDDFAESFRLADVTIVPEIYFVRDSQAAKKEVNSRILVKKMRANKTEAVFIDGFSQICDYLTANVSRGDLVVTMGAGDIWKVADGYIQRLRANR